MQCASSPELAVLQGLGMGQATTGSRGYRVRDVVVDPLLQRTFVRVESCDSPHQAPLLLPFAAAQTAARKTSFVALPQTAPAIKVGSAVELSMQSSRVNLLLHGKTLTAADLGSQVEVEAAPLQAGEPGRRFRGTLVAANRVEIEP